MVLIAIVAAYALSVAGVLAYMYFRMEETGEGRVLVAAAAFVPVLNTVLAFLCLKLAVEEWFWSE